MVRVLVAAALVAWVGVADAGPKRKVTIETEPAGASIYLGDVENGPVCEDTPCSVNLPIGEQILVIELAGHQRMYTSVVVPARGKLKTSTFKLEKAIGTIVVDGPRGARVVVGDTDHGKAPVRIEVAAEPHRVVVSLGGKTLYDDYIEVGSGEEVPVAVKRVAGGGGGRADPDDDEAPLDGDDDDGGSAGGIRTGTGTPARRAAYLRVTAALDIGFRHFVYANVETPQTLREESEAGQLLGGPIIELWPGAMAKVAALRGLSLVGRFQFGLNSQQVTGNGIMNETSTFWQSIEVSLRHRWTFGAKLGVELGAGYVQDRHQFSGRPEDIALVPDAHYQSMRLGARVSAVLGTLEPYLSVENRFVMAGGKLEARFAEGTSISGIRGSLGVSARFGKLSARLEGTATRYSWDFTFMPSAAYRAESATDSIRQIQLAVGYEY